jgi:hypothetical protein
VRENIYANGIKVGQSLIQSKANVQTNLKLMVYTAQTTHGYFELTTSPKGSANRKLTPKPTDTIRCFFSQPIIEQL